MKVIITNYPEGEIEYLEAVNNVENPELGTRKSLSQETSILTGMILFFKNRINIINV